MAAVPRTCKAILIEVGRNPARAYARATTCSTERANKVTAIKNRYKPVHRSAKNEAWASRGASARADVRAVQSGANKKTNVDSTARVRGDKVQLRRIPNPEGKDVMFSVTDFQKTDRTLDRRSVQARCKSITTSTWEAHGERLIRRPLGKQKSYASCETCDGARHDGK